MIVTNLQSGEVAPSSGWFAWLPFPFAPGLRGRRPLSPQQSKPHVQPRPAYRIKAPARSARRAYQTGLDYLHGKGVPVSEAEAIRWLRIAGRGGHGGAQALLAVFCLRGIDVDPGGKYQMRLVDLFGASNATAQPDYVRATHWARQSAANGDPFGQAFLAHILMSGPEHSRDLAQAEELFERSAKAGCAQGMLGFASVLDRKANDPGLRRRSVGYVTQAAAAGLPAALFSLGNLHEHGAGVPQDLGRAAQLYQQAADSGHVRAQVRWGLALLQGTLTTADPQAGEALLRQAALAGDETAWEHLAAMVRPGAAGAVDPVETARWFERLAERGNLNAAFYHGVCLALGIGTEPDEAEAAHWLRLAADELPKAQYWFGRMLAEGRGATRDAAAGKAWIERAATNGWLEAKSALDEEQSMQATLVKSLAAAKPLNAGVVGAQVLAHPALQPRAVEKSERNVEAPAQDSLSLACACGSGLRTGRCCGLDPTYRADPVDVVQTQAKSELAAAAFGSGDHATAARLCLEALDVAPRLTLAIWTLCQIRMTSRQPEAARRLLERLVTLEPNNARWHQQLALLHVRSGDFTAAEPHARNAIRLAPQDPVSHNLMGMILTETSRFAGAEFHYRRVFELTPEFDPILQANLAWNLKCQGKFTEARTLYQSSVALAPDEFQTLLGWAQLEEADRNFTGAQDLLDRAGRLQPGDAGLALARASIAERQGKPGIALAHIEPLAGPKLATSTQTIANRADLLLQRGRLLDGLQRHEDAFACFAEGKQLLREASGKSYAAIEAEAMAARLKLFFVKSNVALIEPARLRPDCAQPVFILGFPRSGTTLVEQVLSSHPAVAAGDELPFVNEIADAVPRLLGGSLAYPEGLGELWFGDNRLGAECLRDMYLQKAASRKLTAPEFRLFTDKMPLNEFHLGLIALMFPQSPLLHVVRHPLDVVVSAFSHAMTHGFHCTNSLEGIAHHYVLVMEIVQHYRQVFALKFLEVRYEDLIGTIETGVRDMLDHAGLPQDDRCVAFHLNRRVPLTPSSAQVSEKLYSRSRYRYRNYLKQLEPVLPILAPTIERMGYTIE